MKWSCSNFVFLCFLSQFKLKLILLALQDISVVPSEKATEAVCVRRSLKPDQDLSLLQTVLCHKASSCLHLAFKILPRCDYS